MQGLLKAVAANAMGEQLMTANLEVRGQAPKFEETPLKCTILEGENDMLIDQIFHIHIITYNAQQKCIRYPHVISKVQGSVDKNISNKPETIFHLLVLRH